jgi:hypothetical protein
MGITYRVGNEGRLTVQQMDDNFHYIEEQLAGLSSSNSVTGATGPAGATGPQGATGSSVTPTFEQVTQAGSTTSQSFYQSISGEGNTINTGVFGSYGSSSNPLTIGMQYVQNGVPVISSGFVAGEGPALRYSANFGGLQKELLFSLPFGKENPRYPDPDFYTLATTDDLPKIFKGVFNQTGTASPVVQEYYNNTGYTFSNWQRFNDGSYALSVARNGASFSYINVGQNYTDGELSKTSAYTTFNAKTGNQDYYVYTYDDGILSDSIAYNMFIEIGLK